MLIYLSNAMSRSFAYFLVLAKRVAFLTFAITWPCSSLLPWLLINGYLTSVKMSFCSGAAWYFRRSHSKQKHAPTLGKSPLVPLACKFGCLSAKEWNVVFKLEKTRMVQHGLHLADEPFFLPEDGRVVVSA